MPLPIETPRLLLRPPTPADLDAYMAVFGDMRVVRWIHRDAPETREQVLARIERAQRFQRELGFCIWAVCLRGTGEVVGDCGVVPVERKGPEIEIAWRFNPAHWGRGYATEAARAAMGYALTEAGLERVIAVADRDNEASMRVMRKLGMTDRGEGFYYGRTVRLFDMTADRWRARGAPIS